MTVIYNYFDHITPISPNACLMCVAKVMGNVNAFSVRSWTLCTYHYADWADEKMAGEDYW